MQLYDIATLQLCNIATVQHSNFATLQQWSGQISWTDQVDRPAGRTSSLYLKPWQVRIFEDQPFSLYIVYHCLVFPVNSLAIWVGSKIEK